MLLLCVCACAEGFSLKDLCIGEGDAMRLSHSAGRIPCLAPCATVQECTLKVPMCILASAGIKQLYFHLSNRLLCLSHFADTLLFNLPCVKSKTARHLAACAIPGLPSLGFPSWSRLRGRCGHLSRPFSMRTPRSLVTSLTPSAQTHHPPGRLTRR